MQSLFSFTPRRIQTILWKPHYERSSWKWQKKNGLENLGGAVIDRAVKDYIKTKLDMEKAFDLLEELQDFFEGEGYEFWSNGDVNGKEVMNRCDEVVEKKLKTWRKRREKEMAAAV